MSLGINIPIAVFYEFKLLLAQPDYSHLKVMSHIIPCPNDIPPYSDNKMPYSYIILPHPDIVIHILVST